MLPLEVQHPLPLSMQVRTKKRYFIPPAVNKKKETNRDIEERLRAAGTVPPQEIVERQINISCTVGVFDPYIPPEGDARLSTLSKDGLKQRTVQLRQTAASQLAFRKIREYDSLFSTKTFAEQAQEIFIEAHNLLCRLNGGFMFLYPKLHMTRGNRLKTIRWAFVESLEPPRVVHSRCPDMISKDNLYGQVTVRMHSKQTLAIYDRFGRLMLGSEEQPKDVLEYLVIERHLTNRYGRWRLHGKIVPSWAPAKDPIIKTIMIPGPKLRPEDEPDAVKIEIPKPAAVQWYK
uniref:Large ribosomal subunit protein mL45 n=1 Tax=Cynoglossus semilaevis TaxID=244447 RepID=A0A3P8X3K9_CYNSE